VLSHRRVTSDDGNQWYISKERKEGFCGSTTDDEDLRRQTAHPDLNIVQHVHGSQQHMVTYKYTHFFICQLKSY
jgi:hypothetical protein